MMLYCKTHDVLLEYDEKTKRKTLTWEYGKNPRCILLTMRVEELKEGKFGDCEVVKL